MSFSNHRTNHAFIPLYVKAISVTCSVSDCNLFIRPSCFPKVGAKPNTRLVEKPFGIAIKLKMMMALKQTFAFHRECGGHVNFSMEIPCSFLICHLQFTTLLSYQHLSFTAKYPFKVFFLFIQLLAFGKIIQSSFRTFPLASNKQNVGLEEWLLAWQCVIQTPYVYRIVGYS